MPTPLTPIFAALLNGLDAAYRRGVPLLTDAAYDRLSRMCPNSLPPLSDLLSLDCPPDPADWLARNPGPYAVQLKADGVSVVLIYLDGGGAVGDGAAQGGEAGAFEPGKRGAARRHRV